MAGHIYCFACLFFPACDTKKVPAGFARVTGPVSIRSKLRCHSRQALITGIQNMPKGIFCKSTLPVHPCTGIPVRRALSKYQDGVKKSVAKQYMRPNEVFDRTSDICILRTISRQFLASRRLINRRVRKTCPLACFECRLGAPGASGIVCLSVLCEDRGQCVGSKKPHQRIFADEKLSTRLRLV